MPAQILYHRRLCRTLSPRGFLADLWAAAEAGQPLFLTTLRKNGRVIGYGVHRSRETHDFARRVDQMADAYFDRRAGAKA